MMQYYDSIQNARRSVLKALHEGGSEIKTKKWQGVEPPESMIEILNVDFSTPIPLTIQKMIFECSPNLPWADEHFEERVGGLPTNPGEAYKTWPFWKGGHQIEGEFTHTYQQRLWAKPIPGLKYRFGNLMDVVELLRKEPDTRQAFIPVWFPEDTGAIHGGRVPCTIGYHVIIRENKVHIRYYLRSCDARRHFNDDLYLCCRLANWIREQVDTNIGLGILTMNITSFHVFSSDFYWLTKQVK